MENKITAKDFFLHVAAIASLYAGTIALLNILFNAINTAFPQVNRYYDYYYGGYSSNPLSLPVATLVVVFPLFLVLTNILRKSYEQDPTRKEYALRKWLIYITLFIAGAILAGDLITVIYYFLDGRELTTTFLLKVLSVFVVIGVIFGYYIDDLKNKLTGSRRTVWRVIGAILVVGSIVIGFAVLGSPRTQRFLRYDSQKISDLQNIQWQIVSHWQQRGSLPNSLSELQNSFTGYMVPLDLQTGESYEYNKTGNTSFELCADFNKESRIMMNGYPMPMLRVMSDIKPTAPQNDNWHHGEGRTCFTRTIDPQLYPINKPVI